MQFVGKTVLVTGAGSGIGTQMAGLFGAEGAVVYAADLTVDEVPGSMHVLRLDVRDPAMIQTVVDQIVRETGRLDVLCNNAGIGSTADAISCSVEEWDDVMDVNARGVFLATSYALPHMLRQRSGVIVNTASVAGLVGLPDRAAYCASKGAVIAFTRQVAIQYARAGIRCNCICPGTIDSPWVARPIAASANPEAARAALVARQPMGRLGTSEEAARTAVFLASAQASFITGAALTVDGGITAA